MRNLPPLTMMYSASRVRSFWRSGSKRRVPSTTISFKGILGPDSSTTRVCPLGTNMVSPSLGGASPPQVSTWDQSRAPV